MKLDIKGASNFVNRMFEACGKFQWAREFLKNAIEANATKVEFGIEWQAVKKFGFYRRTIVDNGDGMTASELLRFFSTLGEGAKKIGTIHDNFGVGAKIASLPWNPNGLVVMSYKNHQASMIWIVLDEDSGEYELVEFTNSDGNRTYVIDPNLIEEDGIKWGNIAPDWATEHGTLVVLLGSDPYPDTILGNPSDTEGDLKGIAAYLNSRFWELQKIEVTVTELNTNKKNQWPQGIEDREKYRNRRIQGAHHYLDYKETKEGKLAYSGILDIVDRRVKLEWYLWEGKRPDIHNHAKENGYIAIRYDEELFHVTSGKVEFRHFGIIESAVQANLTLILEPQHYKPGNILWGVHPDQSRNQIIFTGNGEKGISVPLVEWGQEFSQKLPQVILDAIRKARGSLNGSISDEDYRKRLQDRFGNRWTVKMLVEDFKKTLKPVKSSEEEVTVFRGGDGEKITDSESKVPRRRKKVISTVNPDNNGVEREIPVDVPKYEFANKDDFEQPWHLALWAPNDASGPTVFINVDSPILQESVEHHLKQYPDVFAEEVADTVRRVFGELAACKIAHSQTLKKHIPEQDLDKQYRSEQALTIALMGLLAEESVIAYRLKKLGQKKILGDNVLEASSSSQKIN